MADYDSKTCVTAAELRQAGIAVPEDIPDVAWIARHYVRVSVRDVVQEGSMFKTVFDVDFSAPFQWVKVAVSF